MTSNIVTSVKAQSMVMLCLGILVMFVFIRTFQADSVDWIIRGKVAVNTLSM